MNDELFAELLESVREGGAILQGEKILSRTFEIEASTSIPKDNETPVMLRPVSRDNWRDVAKLEVTPAQREFVAVPSHYLALCHYSRRQASLRFARLCGNG